MFYKKNLKIIIGISLFCIGFAIHLFFLLILVGLHTLDSWKTQDRIAIFIIAILGGVLTLLGILFMIRGYMEKYILGYLPMTSSPALQRVADNPPIQLKPGIKR